MLTVMRFVFLAVTLGLLLYRLSWAIWMMSYPYVDNEACARHALLLFALFCLNALLLIGSVTFVIVRSIRKNRRPSPSPSTF